MEERLTDEPIKLDGLDGLPDEPEMPEAEDEIDEDLVGLTPSRLQEELAKRRAAEDRARREYEKLIEGAESLRHAGKFAEAEKLYRQAALYDPAAEEGLWAARTEEYTSTACFFKRSYAGDFAEAGARVRETVFAHMGPKIRAEKEAYEAEAAPLRTEVEAGRDSRREAFAANRNYWLWRFLGVLALFLAMGIACAVAGSYIVRTRGTAAPIATVVFGVLTLVSLAAVFILARKLFVAQRLVSDNEKLSSTEKGARLAELERRIGLLTLVLEGPAEDEDYTEDGTEDDTEDGAEEAPAEPSESPTEDAEL